MALHRSPPSASPEFEADDLDCAMGELLHMIWQAKRAARLPQEFNPLLSYRCMQIIGLQRRDIAERCIQILNDTKPGIAWVRYELISITMSLMLAYVLTAAARTLSETEDQMEAELVTNRGNRI